MSELQKRVLRKLAQDKTDQEDVFGSKVLDALDRPGRATRAAIGAYQQDEPIMDAIKAQFQPGAPEAPSGADLAEHVQDKYDIQNPMALAAMATAADIADPTMFIPGGQITKLSKLGTLAKMAGKSDDVARMAKAGSKTESAAELLQKAEPSKFGKLAIKPSAADLEMEAMKKAGQARLAVKQAADKKKALEKIGEQTPELSDFEKRLKLFKERKSR